MQSNDSCTRSLDSDDIEDRGIRVGRRGFLLGSAAAAGLAFAPSAFALSRQDFNASSSWATAPVSAAPSDANRINGQTIRQLVHISVGGDAMRVRMSNRYGTAPLVVGAASVGVAGAGASVLGQARQLTFSGKTSFTIPAYGELVSDWLPGTVANLADLAIDLYIAADTSAGTSPLTLHTARPTGQIAAYVATGNVAGASTFPTADARTAWYFLTGVDVSNGRSPGTVCCFGDSITDGNGSTPNTNTRYPDYLANRLLAATSSAPIGVANVGISGNRVLYGTPNSDGALARFDRDVLSLSGAWNVIVLEGINDLNGGFPATRVIEGHRQLIRRAHAKGKRIYGATVTPFGRGTDAVEAQRQELNAFIRSGGEFDGVFDFDVALRDPANPRVMLAPYDSGDTLHPSSAGYAAMAAAVDISVFAGPRPRMI